MFGFLKDKDRTPPVLPEGTVRRRYVVSGGVQGVGFRYRARYAASQLGLSGWVENEDDGTVTRAVQGDPALVARMFDMIALVGYVQITVILSQDIALDPWARGFSVRGY